MESVMETGYRGVYASPMDGYKAVDLDQLEEPP